MRTTKLAVTFVGLTIAVPTAVVGLSTSASAEARHPDCQDQRGQHGEQGQYPPDEPQPKLDSDNHHDGENFRFEGEHFKKGEEVDADMCSTGIRVGHFTADSNGNVTGTVTIPNSLQAGLHQFILSGASSGVVARTNFTIVAAGSGAGGTGGTGSTSGGSSLPFTGANVLPLLGIGGALVIGGGAAVVVARRRKTSQTAA